jgi:hypothetical protein
MNLLSSAAAAAARACSSSNAHANAHGHARPRAPHCLPCTPDDIALLTALGTSRTVWPFTSLTGDRTTPEFRKQNICQCCTRIAGDCAGPGNLAQRRCVAMPQQSLLPWRREMCTTAPTVWAVHTERHTAMLHVVPRGIGRPTRDSNKDRDAVWRTPTGRVRDKGQNKTAI